ncbi:MAG: DEAD/DEAH box helicase family protein [Nanoarchaeota archaeon]|nr:DEAD/DEAH box helicase family protein [Nanoarchaeota archaeon]
MNPEEQLKIQQDEWTLVEEPAIELFKKLNYNFYENKQIKRELHQFFLIDVLKKKIKELNSWISENNLNKVMREITLLQATSTIEANEKFFYKLVNYISVKQDLGKGNKSQTVKIIDFENPDKNDFTIINQFYIKSKDFPIKPDLVAFINGIPIAVIECKSPHIEEPIDEAISQLFGYREKNEQFFYPNQLLVALAKFRAEYGSTFSKAKYFFNWREPYPLSREQLKDKLGKSTLTEQDILLYSLFDKENILDIIRNYTVFEEQDNDKVKKVCRYVQFIAGNKIIKRLEEHKGGVIWHTQGSGKSLTMQFSAIKLRRLNKLKSLENPCIVIVTDRTDLDDQITNTFVTAIFQILSQLIVLKI